MQEGGRKNEASGSTRYHITLSNKVAPMAPPDTLPDSYTRIFPEAQPYLNSMTRTPKSNLFSIALPKYTLC